MADQFCWGMRSSSPWLPWAWPSIRPGMMVLPATSTWRAPAGMVTEPRGPTARMRLPSIRITPSSMMPPRRIRHGDDARADERDPAGRRVGGDRDRRASSRRGRRIGGAAGRVAEQIGNVRAVERRPKAPGEPVARPIGINGAAGGDAGDRQLRAARADLHHPRRAEEGARRTDCNSREGEAAAVGRDLVAGDHLALGVVATVAAVQIDADQPALLVLGDLKENPVGSPPNCGLPPSPRMRVEGPPAAGTRKIPVCRRPLIGRQPLPAGEFVDDHRPVGREARTAIMAGRLRDRAQVAPVGGDGADFAQALVVPRDEGDPAAVARPGRGRAGNRRPAR